MTKYAKLKAEKDEVIKEVNSTKDNKKIASLVKKAEKIQDEIDNMTIAEAMREAE